MGNNVSISNCVIEVKPDLSNYGEALLAMANAATKNAEAISEIARAYRSAPIKISPAIAIGGDLDQTTDD